MRRTARLRRQGWFLQFWAHTFLDCLCPARYSLDLAAVFELPECKRPRRGEEVGKRFLMKRNRGAYTFLKSSL